MFPLFNPTLATKSGVLAKTMIGRMAVATTTMTDSDGTILQWSKYLPYATDRASEAENFAAEDE
jgi:hypothetical protein